jgi:hypothetical protein
MNEERPEGGRSQRLGGQARTPEAYTEQRTPGDVWIPNHWLHPAEANLRLVVNTLPRERPHWWLRTWEGRHQRELLERLGWWAA